MSGKIGDLLNFTFDDSAPVSVVSPNNTQGIKKSNNNNNLLVPENVMTKPGDGRKSLDNNPFDRVCKQVETFSSDPFEFVSAQSKNFKPVMSCIRTGNLLGLGEESFLSDKENNNNEGNLSPNKMMEKASPKKPRKSDSGNKRDNLLKRSIANASKSAMKNDVVKENQMGEKWMNMDMPDDSFNDLMKQEIDLVDSDNSLNDFESEFNIPMLKELEDNNKKDETSPVVETEEEEKIGKTNDSHTSIIDRAIAKLNEIKKGKARESNLDDTMTKLKEMVSKVDTEGNGEASKLVDQLCAALNKTTISTNKNTLEPPPVMVRQGTFDIDKTEEDNSVNDISNNSENGSPQLQSVIEKLSEVLGNVNMNVIQSSPDNASNSNPVVVVVVNPEMGGYGMSDTVTIQQHLNYNTPQMKSKARRSQSFSSACRPNIIAPNTARRDSFVQGTPQRPVQPTRRSFSFSSPVPQNPIVQKRSSILPSVTLNPKNAAPLKTPSDLLAKPGASNTANRLSFMDKLKPKIGFSSVTQKKPASKPIPLKVVHREIPSNSFTNTPKQTPIAQSTPMSRIATPQKPSRVSFLTPSRPTTSATTQTVPKQPAATNVKRRASFNVKEKPSVSQTNLKPKQNMMRPSTGGLLTQRKFPLNKSPSATSNSVKTNGVRPTMKGLQLKLKK